MADGKLALTRGFELGPLLWSEDGEGKQIDPRRRNLR
jgi:hypothetical protein